MKGSGFRDVEKKLPMTPETQMPIASMTKQFTIAALGTLVRQGKLDWDKPVREYLPDFRMNNECATANAPLGFSFGYRWQPRDSSLIVAVPKS